MVLYIALFRGINVGGRNRLPMRDLEAILQKIGCKQIKTYIQSGNAIFHIDSPNRRELASKIGQAVMDHWGFEPKILLLDREELHQAVRNNPYKTDSGKNLQLYFLERLPSDSDLERLSAYRLATESFQLVDSVFYLYAPDGIGRSKLAARVEKYLGVPATARNWNTVKKLVEMVG